MRRRVSRLILAVVLLCGPAVPATAAAATPAPSGTAPVPVPLTGLVNDDGIGGSPGQADFDGSHYSYPADQVPAAGAVTLGGVPYAFPGADGDDNVVALGQDVALPRGHYVTAYVLGSSSYGQTGGTATVHYADGGTTQAALSAPDWYSGGTGAVNAAYRYSPTDTDAHPVAIFPLSVWLDPAREATSITLPTTASPAAGTSSLHVFALSLQPAVHGYAVRVGDAASTTKTTAAGRQIVEATVANLGDQWLSPDHRATVTVTAPGVQTTAPATVDRLAPGDSQRVEVAIAPTRPTAAGTAVPGQVTARVAGGPSAAQDLTLHVGVPAYEASDASLGTHQAPDWFSDAKFGIFIHWGVYSVPAWAPVGQEYAEWYWQHMNDPNDPTYAHHAETYGKDFSYDSFIPRFTAAKFDPQAWVRLFQDAGAKYFVLTSKHHEGFSLFDTAVSDRNSVKMGPHKDLVGSLFAAARKYTPGVHPGVYYSLPEWYDPALPWQGHGPQNPYTGEPEPYTGYKPVQDYVADLQAPQMEELIHKYSPDVMWCDIGTPAAPRSVFADYLNHAASEGHQVTYDDRCGIPTHDYTTPEYAKYGDTVVAKWEASRGLDPFSYGYNAATPDSAYMTAEDAVQDLVDIVSKNGNFLLDIGPRADGTIPQVMQDRLRAIGAWLKVNGESVYGTSYWSREASAGDDIRFTVAPNKAFYITSFARPGGQVTVNAPVPVRAGQRITLLGSDGKPLKWTASNGTLTIDVPPAARRTGQYAWVFKVDWS
ncbi:alpha-L-fucosidase [Actinomadura sp. DC4]|uniref:alpha-L-fucosidase n=1 Tax=Actinomadura sp. DC4 TaxID=3055069 RepID=UPI0025AEF7CE|nr:alpha-L-fucosidase [Actinomadura sp. DC4]MDN3355123.1 alpha-L-fucosidase [Actinomadura sp. DC4]